MPPQSICFALPFAYKDGLGASPCCFCLSVNLSLHVREVLCGRTITVKHMFYFIHSTLPNLKCWVCLFTQEKLCALPCMSVQLDALPMLWVLMANGPHLYPFLRVTHDQEEPSSPDMIPKRLWWLRSPLTDCNQRQIAQIQCRVRWGSLAWPLAVQGASWDWTDSHVFAWLKVSPHVVLPTMLPDNLPVRLVESSINCPKTSPSDPISRDLALTVF